MALDPRLIKRLHKSLAVVDDHGTVGSRLHDDADRLWARLQRFIGMSLVTTAGLQLDAVQLACLALQLPQRRAKTSPSGRQTRSTLRERSEESAELLVSIAAGDASEELLDRTVRILQEMHHRSPMLDESKLLADALNLEDFGMIGLIDQALQAGRHGGSINQVADGLEKRDQYGFWEARLKDSFHFERIRQLARRRLQNAQKAAEMLRSEMHDDKL